MIRRVNFFAGPASGKSTTASWLFSELKRKDYNVELVTEYVKSWAVTNKPVQPLDQIYLLGKQTHYEHRFLSHGVDTVITDSPVFLGGCYSDHYAPELGLSEHIFNICDVYERKYPSFNIFLDRGDKPYSEIGRYQTLDQSLKIDENIKKNLTARRISYIILPFNEPDLILKEVLNVLEHPSEKKYK